MVPEYDELRRIRKEAEEFLLGENKAYGTITNDGAGNYRIVINIGTEEWHNIADEVRVLLQRKRRPGEQGQVISIVREIPSDMEESETNAKEVVQGLERDSDDPKGRLPVQREEWSCSVRSEIVDSVRKDLTNRIGR